MSSYFDTKANEIRALIVAGRTPAHDDVRLWVRTLTLDMATCCEFDRAGPLAFPADLRDACYRAILSHAPDSWPAGTPGWGVDYGRDEDGMRLLANLVERLHDLFHAAAAAGWPGRDNPLSAVHAMDARMEERCAALIAEEPALNLAAAVTL